MSDATEAPLPVQRLPLLFLIVLGLVTTLFVAAGVVRSNRSTLRGDETVTLLWNRENQTPMEMLQQGAQRQTSPAPLYYLIDRTFDESRDRLNYLGLNYSGYYRLPSVLCTAGFGLAAALMLAFRLRREETPTEPTAWVLLLSGLATYWFHPKVFSFACTDRPYGLWNGLWLLSLVWLLCRPESKIGLAVLLSLLASTATAACFQILAVGVAFGVVGRLRRRPPKEILRDGFAIFSVPALIGGYYALRSGQSEAEGAFDGDFSLPRFWLVTNLPAWLAAGIAGLLVWKRPRLKPAAVPVLAFGVLLLMIPLIYALARSKGYPSPSRQYLWTATGIPLTLFVAALGWSEFRSGRPVSVLAVLISGGLVAGYSVATFHRASARNDARILTCLDSESPLDVLLRQERPRSFYYLPTLGGIEAKNVSLLAEWMRVRYRDLPIGTKVVILSDAEGRLKGDVVDTPPGKWPQWIDLTIPR
ncbi:MAG TPA: hypothetical protein VG457_05060 [Planctomycetota bacterium]|nr:hypothetical protein [Planctomycetota bacterium]